MSSSYMRLYFSGERTKVSGKGVVGYRISAQTAMEIPQLQMPMIRPLKRSTQSQQVLVTGGSGFLGMYCILQLLDLGYRVRCTVRSLTREPEVRRTLEQMGASSIGASLSFIEADLSADPDWDDAAAGSSYVLHVASPFSVGQKDGNIDTIGIARSGTLRGLRAAHEAKVKRLVITSSFVTMSYAREMDTAEFTEADWSDLSIPTLTAYVRSKTLAEKDAWDFVRRKGGPELTAVNPTVILGPVMCPDYSPSISLIQRMLDGNLPLAPKLSYGIVDVRDVADLHIRAMTDPAANGERFVAIAGETMSIYEIARVLRSRLGAHGAKAPRFEMPNWAMRLLALVSPAASAIAGMSALRGQSCLRPPMTSKTAATYDSSLSSRKLDTTRRFC
ncbi:NAD-dependent epimerase/dehydratase family protein, partial [Mesorhizobium sp. M7A.F.Ca.MR.176.00.0.0]